MTFVGACLALLLVLLVWRLVSLQVLDTERGYRFLQGQGDARSLRVEPIPAYRGIISDRHGEPWRLFLGVGVLGGFTTFSAYSLETMRMIERNDWVGASTYSIGSVIAGLVAVAIGLAMAKRVLG